MSYIDFIISYKWLVLFIFFMASIFPLLVTGCGRWIKDTGKSSNYEVLFVCCAFYGIFLFATVAFWQVKLEADQIAKTCEAHNMKLISRTEYGYKTSNTSHFCVNSEGQVFAPEALK